MITYWYLKKLWNIFYVENFRWVFLIFLSFLLLILPLFSVNKSKNFNLINEFLSIFTSEMYKLEWENSRG